MSDYVPTDWVDNVTPVDAARMDKIEAGIDLNRDAVIDHETRLDAVEADLPTKQETSEKGQANGYAPLGADTKVPAIYLPAGGSGAIDYENAWAAGTAYTPGDVVIHNGIEYLAVNPSTGQTPPASPAVAGATVIPLVTALPSSPFDGQEVDLTDSLTTPSWVWRFRYVAAAPTNKWKFVGGAPLFSEIGAAEATASGTYVSLTTPGPTLTPPVSGEYLVGISCTAYMPTAAGAYMSFSIGAAAALDAESTSSVIHGTRSSTLMREQKKGALVAGAALLARYRTDSGVSGTFSTRWMSLTPVAVG